MLLKGAGWFQHILYVSRSERAGREVRVRAFAMPAWIWVNVSSGIGWEKSTPLTSAAKVGWRGINSISCLCGIVGCAVLISEWYLCGQYLIYLHRDR